MVRQNTSGNRFALNFEMLPLRHSLHYPLGLLALFAFSAGIFFLLLNLYLWWRFHVHLPMHDTAHVLPLVQQAIEQGFWSIELEGWLATHASAHRIAITRLLMLVDFRYFGGQNHVIFAFTWLSMVVTLLVYAGAFRHSFRAEQTLLVFVVGLVLVFLSSPTQFWNVINPINGSWYVAFAASALAIWLIANTPAVPAWRYLAAAYLLAIIAAFSNFAGALVWLVLPLLIALRNTRAGLIAALLSGLFVWLYARGVALDFSAPKDPAVIEQLRNANPQQPESVAGLLQRCATAVKETGRYLGSPLSIEHPRLANWLVLFSYPPIVAGWLLLLTQRYRGRYCHNLWFELTLTMATLCLGIAIATQMGREHLWEPTAERYQNVVMMYWLNVCGLLLVFALRAPTRLPAWRFAAAILCVIVAVLLLASPSNSVNRSVRDAGRAKAVQVLGELGISEKRFNRRILNRYSRDYFSEFHTFFMRNHVVYGAAGLRRIDFEAPHECAQVKLAATSSQWPGIYNVTGTIDDYSSKWYRRIPVSTERGEVIGFIFPVFKDKLTFRHLLVERASKWEGYFSAPANAEPDVYLHYRSPPFAKLSCRIPA